MSRREARDVAFKLVFEFMFSGEKKEELVSEYASDFSGKDKNDDLAYVNEIYNGVAEHYDELNQILSESVEKFELERLYKVDRALLLLAIYEIKFVKSVPFKVSANEAITLAKKYSTEKSAKYINGVLSKFAD